MGTNLGDGTTIPPRAPAYVQPSLSVRTGAVTAVSVAIVVRRAEIMTDPKMRPMSLQRMWKRMAPLSLTQKMMLTLRKTLWS